MSPNRRTLIATASEISSRDQPKDSSSGTIKTEGADLNPAVATKELVDEVYASVNDRIKLIKTFGIIQIILEIK